MKERESATQQNRDLLLLYLPDWPCFSIRLKFIQALFRKYSMKLPITWLIFLGIYLIQPGRLGWGPLYVLPNIQYETKYFLASEKHDKIFYKQRNQN